MSTEPYGKWLSLHTGTNWYKLPLPLEAYPRPPHYAKLNKPDVLLTVSLTLQTTSAHLSGDLCPVQSAAPYISLSDPVSSTHQNTVPLDGQAWGLC